MPRPSKPAPISDVEKSQIKDFLLTKTFINQEVDLKLRDLLRICIAHITKFNFIQDWTQLNMILIEKSKFLDEDLLKLINLILKVQEKIHRLNKFPTKELVQSLFSNIQPF